MTAVNGQPAVMHTDWQLQLTPNGDVSLADHHSPA